MKKYIISLMLIFLLTSCGENKTNEKINISTSIIPISSITNYIGNGIINTTSIIPAGVSPHGFDLKPNEVKSIVDSDLIVYLGLEHVDNFLDKILDENKALKLSNYLELHNGHEHEDDISEHSLDSHVWTSQKNAVIIAEKITEKLIMLIPEKKELFENNLLAFEFETIELIRAFEDNTKGKIPKSFIVFHDAYNYLFEELGISEDKKSVFQSSVINEMSINEMKKLEDEIKEKNIKFIFREPQFSSSNLEKFAGDNNLEILILDPLGQDYSASGYIENLRNNLVNIEKIYE